MLTSRGKHRGGGTLGPRREREREHATAYAGFQMLLGRGVVECVWSQIRASLRPFNLSKSHGKGTVSYSNHSAADISILTRMNFAPVFNTITYPVVLKPCYATQFL